MAMLKWTVESLWAGAAVILTTIGGLYTTSYHWGQVNSQVEELKSRSTMIESHIDKHDEQLTEIKQQNAGMAQSLNDIKDTVHDIQTQVRKKKHDDNN
jgi:archaellum component FlaC